MMIETKVQQTTPAMVENNTSKRKPASQRSKEEQQTIPDSATTASGKATRRLNNKAEHVNMRYFKQTTYHIVQYNIPTAKPRANHFFYEEAKIF
jgi:hypothetical protein